MPLRILYGPQRPVTNLRDIAANSELPPGTFAVISAGWQEDEAYTDELGQILGRPLQDLRLYNRADQVFADDPKLREAYRERQERLMELQRLYRGRLRQLMIAARQMQRSKAHADLIEPERRHAIEQLRALDRHHCNRVEEIHTNYANDINANQSSVLAEQVAAIVEQLADYETVVITGGNVVVLLNRLHLFGMAEHLQSKHIVAWSAGAMVLGSQVVLFHDRTSQGRRDPEIISPGIGLLAELVVFPDAKHRLKSRDPMRVGIISRRFAPACCVTLDSGTTLQFDGDRLRKATEARRLTRSNGLVRIRTA